MINEKRLINTFVKLVRIDSPSGNEENVCKWIKNELSKLGLSCKIDNAGNILARLHGKGESILLSGHMDTVEPGRGIKPIVRNGKITSDGTTILGADNKANVAAIIELVRIINERKLTSHPMEIVFSTQEEPGLVGIKQFDFSQLRSKIGFCFDKADDVGTIVISSPFCVNIDGKVIGKSAHSGSEPEEGVNAFAVFANIITGLNIGRIDEETTSNIGVVTSGSTRNTVPEVVNFFGEIRSQSNKKLSKQLNLWKNRFNELTKKNHAKLKWKTTYAYKGYTLKPNSKVVNKANEVFKHLGISHSMVVSGGASDANIFNEHNIQVVDLGYGAKKSHSLNECISIKDLVLLCKIQAALVIDLKIDFSLNSQ